MDCLAIACRCLIGLLFGVSAFSKVRDSVAFAEFTASTRALLAGALPGHGPHAMARRWLPSAVVVTEAAVVALVAVPAAARFGFGLASVLLAGFTLAIAAAIRRSVLTTCRCFGASSAPLGASHLVRNGVLLLVALTGLAVGPGDLARVDRAALIMTIGPAAIAVVVIARLDDLVALFAPGTGRHADGRR
jgi:hypothetical protein